MKNFIKEYFNFSKREQNGMLVLFAILLVLIGANVFFSVHKSNQKVDFSDFETEIDSFLVYQQTHFDDSELFAFDPNTATREDLLRLGLSPKSVNGIMNYREKGYKFYKPEDIMRVRTLKPEEYEEIKDYIVIEKPSYSNNRQYNRDYSYQNGEQAEVELFEFDPNTASKDELERLGFKPWQAENILKYRSKGGKFKQPSDITKIHGIDKDFAEKLIPYIKIESQAQTASYDILVNINTATAADFQKLKGIGETYSKRIIAYREKLGGFIAVEQMLEVYGMTDELYKSISANLEIKGEQIRTININTADFKTLVSHPYIDNKIANAILNYRDFAKTIKSANELVKQKAISQSDYDKISKYLSVE
ncbi:MAG: helix-hairpin-helix domain-containing protein [Bacteroidales bacterium]|nr:helix-hairpin-helix domain-containing protein [Bacteroidales bacterium]